MIPNRLALGAVLRRDDIRRRRLAATAAMYWSRDEYRARERLLVRLDKILLGVQAQRRWDLIAADLRELADAVERVPHLLLRRELERAAQEATNHQEAA